MLENKVQTLILVILIFYYIEVLSKDFYFEYIKSLKYLIIISQKF